MKTETTDKILRFIEKNERVTVKAIIEYAGISAPAVFKQLKKLLAQKAIQKIGQPPKVIYLIADQETSSSSSNTEMTNGIDPESERTINENYIRINPNGIIAQGVPAFAEWCRTQNLNIAKTANEYRETLKKYDYHKHGGLIDGMNKFQKTFPNHLLFERLFYLDFYAIERFGKTKLGELVTYAKNSQNKQLIHLVVQDIKDRITDLIARYHVDAVGFIPPTIKRDVQFMKELEKELNIPLPTIHITKIKTPIIVAQKGLSHLSERLANARASLIVEETKQYGTVLLIDDAIGSGATMYEIGRQIRTKNICTESLIGLGIVGSFKGFDIIKEL